MDSHFYFSSWNKSRCLLVNNNAFDELLNCLCIAQLTSCFLLSVGSMLQSSHFTFSVSVHVSVRAVRSTHPCCSFSTPVLLEGRG